MFHGRMQRIGDDALVRQHAHTQVRARIPGLLSGSDFINQAAMGILVLGKIGMQRGETTFGGDVF